jgi:hypothetical protein
MFGTASVRNRAHARSYPRRHGSRLVSAFSPGFVENDVAARASSEAARKQLRYRTPGTIFI